MHLRMLPLGIICTPSIDKPTLQMDVYEDGSGSNNSVDKLPPTEHCEDASLIPSCSTFNPNDLLSLPGSASVKSEINDDVMRCTRDECEEPSDHIFNRCDSENSQSSRKRRKQLAPPHKFHLNVSQTGTDETTSDSDNELTNGGQFNDDNEPKFSKIRRLADLCDSEMTFSTGHTNNQFEKETGTKKNSDETSDVNLIEKLQRNNNECNKFLGDITNRTAEISEHNCALPTFNQPKIESNIESEMMMKELIEKTMFYLEPHISGLVGQSLRSSIETIGEKIVSSLKTATQSNRHNLQDNKEASHTAGTSFEMQKHTTEPSIAVDDDFEKYNGMYTTNGSVSNQVNRKLQINNETNGSSSTNSMNFEGKYTDADVPMNNSTNPEEHCCQDNNSFSDVQHNATCVEQNGVIDFSYQSPSFNFYPNTSPRINELPKQDKTTPNETKTQQSMIDDGDVNVGGQLKTEHPMEPSCSAQNNPTSYEDFMRRSLMDLMAKLTPPPPPLPTPQLQSHANQAVRTNLVTSQHTTPDNGLSELTNMIFHQVILE